LAVWGESQESGAGMSEDSRAACAEALKTCLGPFALWQAAIAWASARQEARERRLGGYIAAQVGLMIARSTDTVETFDQTLDRLIAAFNAVEQERKG